MTAGQIRLLRRIQSHDNFLSMRRKGNHHIVTTKCGQTLSKPLGWGRHNALNNLHLQLSSL